jgi:uncharacterized protein YegP (UPF0339 family)
VSGVVERRYWRGEEARMGEHKVQVFHSSGGYYWRRRAANGQVVAVSGEGYESKAHTLSMAESLNPGVLIEVDGEDPYLLPATRTFRADEGQLEVQAWLRQVGMHNPDRPLHANISDEDEQGRRTVTVTDDTLPRPAVEPGTGQGPGW